MTGPKTNFTMIVLASLAALVMVGGGAAVAHANGYFSGRGGAFGGFDATDNGTLDGTFVNANVDVASMTITMLDLDHANSTHPLVASVALDAAEGATVAGSSAGRHCGYVLDDGAGNKLGIEDSPHASFKATSVNGSRLTLVLPPSATIVQHDAVDSWSPAGATIDYGNGQKANLVLKNATLAVSGQSITVTLDDGGMAGFGLVREDGRPGFGHGPGPMGPRAPGAAGGFGGMGHGSRGPR